MPEIRYSWLCRTCGKDLGMLQGGRDHHQEDFPDHIVIRGVGRLVDPAVTTMASVLNNKQRIR